MAALPSDILEVLIAGMTHVLERNGDEAYVYFHPDGTSHMLLETGETRTGRWRLDVSGYTAEWDNGATGRWAIDREPGALTYINRDSAIRVKMLGVLAGNAKGLPRQN